MRFKIVVAGLLAVLVLLFTAQNYEVVEVRFLVWRLEMSRAVLLFAVLGVGVALGWLGAGLGRLSRD